MPALTPKPDIVQYKSPERALQRSIVAEVKSLLDQVNIKNFVLEGFGLDIAVFIKQDEVARTRFFELKAFVGGGAGGVGIGNGEGRGAQVDLLLVPPSELLVAEPSVRWILGMGTIPKGAARYCIFTCTQAKRAVMGKVSRGKQNNLRIADFQDSLIRWDELPGSLHDFLLAE
jgi:hypothetical protein